VNSELEAAALAWLTAHAGDPRSERQQYADQVLYLPRGDEAECDR